jgi:hypothetical protein
MEQRVEKASRHFLELSLSFESNIFVMCKSCFRPPCFYAVMCKSCFRPPCFNAVMCKSCFRPPCFYAVMCKSCFRPPCFYAVMCKSCFIFLRVYCWMELLGFDSSAHQSKTNFRVLILAGEIGGRWERVAICHSLIIPLK